MCSHTMSSWLHGFPSLPLCYPISLPCPSTPNPKEPVDDQWKKSLEIINSMPELNYMTQILFQLFEDPHQPSDSPSRYLINVHFSPGVRGREDLIEAGEEVCHNGEHSSSSSDGAPSLMPQQHDLRRPSASLPGMCICQLLFFFVEGACV